MLATPTQVGAAPASHLRTLLEGFTVEGARSVAERHEPKQISDDTPLPRRPLVSAIALRASSIAATGAGDRAMSWMTIALSTMASGSRRWNT